MFLSKIKSISHNIKFKNISLNNILSDIDWTNSLCSELFFIYNDISLNFKFNASILSDSSDNNSTAECFKQLLTFILYGVSNIAIVVNKF